MNFKLTENCQNVFSINEHENQGKRALTPTDITEMTLIVKKGGFYAQAYDKNSLGNLIYFIQKYDRVLTAQQVKDFCNNHAEENFLLIDDANADIEDVWFYVVSEPNQLTVYCYHSVGEGHMTQFAILKNVYGESQWEEPILLASPFCPEISDQDTYSRWRGVEANKFYFYFQKPGYSYDSQATEGYIINQTSDSYRINTKELMRKHLRISGRTRITLVSGYRNYFTFEAGRKPEIETAPIVKRYGIEINPQYEYTYKYGGKFMYDLTDNFNSEIPTTEWERVKRRLEMKLEQMDKNDKDAYSKVLEASILLITEPIKGHRRPSYHYVAGFRSNHITEVVELSRGELLIKDMIPENVYVLMDDGRYAAASHTIKSEMRERIKNRNTEIDAITFNRWAEERSLHPNLLKLLGEEYFDTIDLDLIKLFNRIPFGSLLVDQLITAGHADLAILLAKHITERAYDFNYYCSKLEDLFPGCNGEETSLYKILNINRSTAKYLFDNVGTAEDFMVKYKAVHYYGGNLVMTDEIKSKVETYLSLYLVKEHTLKLRWGDREFDFLDHPKLAKQVVRMRKKIGGLYDLGYTKDKVVDISNKYDEIVRAYCSFLDYSTIAPAEERDFWLPEHQRIFVEFSLTGTADHPLNPYEEVSSREQDANRALRVYQAKADEKIQQENEAKFAFRRTAINKLRSLVAFETASAAFAGYTVIAPSQIYGPDVVNSVEKEAYDLDHCLFRCYTNRIVSGEYTTMWLRLKTAAAESLITIGITSDGRIEQTRGQGDRDATPEEAKAIAAWAESKVGFVTFKAEGSDVAPGGWPRGVAVPSLPKPDKDWLKRLSQTHA